MITFLLCIAGFTLYSSIAGVVYYYNPLKCGNDTDRKGFSLIWPTTLFLVPAIVTCRMLTKRQNKKLENNKIPQARLHK